MGHEVSQPLGRFQSGDIPNLFSTVTEKDACEVAEIAKVAGPPALNPKSVPYLRTNGQYPYAGKYLNFLCRYGYTAKGAFTSALGIKGLAAFVHNNARAGDGVLLR